MGSILETLKCRGYGIRLEETVTVSHNNERFESQRGVGKRRRRERLGMMEREESTHREDESARQSFLGWRRREERSFLV